MARAVEPAADVAVLERESEVRTLPIDYFWSDVGAWSALDDVLAPDADGLGAAVVAPSSR